MITQFVPAEVNATGVFLVSVKLMLVSYKNSVGMEKLYQRLDDVQGVLRHLEARTRPEINSAEKTLPQGLLNQVSTIGDGAKLAVGKG